MSKALPNSFFNSTISGNFFETFNDTLVSYGVFKTLTILTSFLSILSSVSVLTTPVVVKVLVFIWLVSADSISSSAIMFRLFSSVSNWL